MKNLSGQTLPFAVLGHPIGHTLSPIMHNAAFEELGMDAVYLAFDVHPEKLMNVLNAMSAMNFKGVNLTVPLKEVAFKGLNNIAPSAKMLGAVNTIQFLPDGTLIGHNTDGIGFLLAVNEAFSTKVNGLKIFIIGTGGAGRAIAITCAIENASEITLADIDEQKAQKVAKEIALIAPTVKTICMPSNHAAWKETSLKADLIVQSTPVGMKRDDPPILPPDCFKKGQMAFDLVYMYPETSFMKAAKAGGAITANGLGMLLHQGAAAFTIWTGKPAALSAMRKALEKSVYGNT